MFCITTATSKIKNLKERIKAIPGGTSAGKTIGIEQVLIDLNQSDELPKLTSIVSESFPHLKKGAMRDFKNMMQEANYWKDDNWNATDSIYTFETGSKIEFFSADQPAKVRGPRRDRLFINEANNIPFETYEQLELRTNDSIYLDWNPTNEFWYYTDVKGGEGVEELILTYKDNEALNPAIVKSIESRRHRKEWWKVYGLGQLGSVEGKIYKDWKIIDELPHEARLERYYVDFGYTNDQTAIGAVYKYNGGLIVDEITYQKGLSNKNIADILDTEFANRGKVSVIADSAEPKSIDEIYSYGIPVGPCTKGPGSVFQGISLVQDQRISVTKRSINIIKEERNYLFKVDKNGKILNEPEGINDHHMSGIRYAITDLPKLYRSLTGKEKEDALFNNMIRNKKMGRNRKERLFI